jgi:hypothetical protein
VCDNHASRGSVELDLRPFRPHAAPFGGVEPIEEALLKCPAGVAVPAATHREPERAAKSGGRRSPR